MAGTSEKNLGEEPCSSEEPCVQGGNSSLGPARDEQVPAGFVPGLAVPDSHSISPLFRAQIVSCLVQFPVKFVKSFASLHFVSKRFKGKIFEDDN